MSSGLKGGETECLKYVRRDSHGQVRAQGSIYILGPCLESSPWCQVATSVSLNTSQSLSLILSLSPSPLLQVFQGGHLSEPSLSYQSKPTRPCQSTHAHLHLSHIWYLFIQPLFPSPCFSLLWFPISAPLCPSATCSISQQSGAFLGPSSFHQLLDYCGLVC